MKFWVGDPCYVVDDEVWVDVLDETDLFDNCPIILKWGNRYIDAQSTLFGNGEYEDQFGVQYPVDSGTIGVVEYREGDEEKDLFGVHLVDFNVQPDVYVSGENMIITDGIIRIEINMG